MLCLEMYFNETPLPLQMQVAASGELASCLFLLLPHFCSQAESSQPVRSSHLLQQQLCVEKQLQASPYKMLPSRNAFTANIFQFYGKKMCIVCPAANNLNGILNKITTVDWAMLMKEMQFKTNTGNTRQKFNASFFLFVFSSFVFSVNSSYQSILPHFLNVRPVVPFKCHTLRV